jgi:hypothetical protein
MIAENMLYKFRKLACNIIFRFTSYIHIWSVFQKCSVASVMKEGKEFGGP